MPHRRLLKRWDNWSDGVGYLVDGDHNGFAGAAASDGFCMLGLDGALRPPPGIATSDITLTGYIEHFMPEVDPAGNDYVYITEFIPGAASEGKLHKIQLDPAASWGNSLGSVSYTKRLGEPEKYKGNWYFCQLAASPNNKIYKITTVAPQQNISSDTIDTQTFTSDAGGHLGLVGTGNQLGRYLTTGGVCITVIDGDPLTNADWGAEFPVSDSAVDELGFVSIQGLSFAYNSRGLYTFNDRGDAGIISEDLQAWQGVSGRGAQIVPWKGGLMFSHPTGIYFYPPGGQPIPVSPDHRQENFVAQPPDVLSTLRGGKWNGLVASGEWLYTMYSLPDGTNSYVVAGNAASGRGHRHGDPTEIIWHIIYNVTLP